MRGHRELVLSTGWTLRRDQRRPPSDPAAHRANSPLPATVPGVVHQDLLRHAVIPDPFVAENEQAAQWVGYEDWVYRCGFETDEDLLGFPYVDLCLDGLDTVVTVALNGTVIHSGDNMFLPVRVPVARLLRLGENELTLHFASAVRHGRQRETERGSHAVWNGDPSRVHVRKAQYHYGWDWGPTLMTAGPYRPVRLEAYDVRIADVGCSVTLAEDHSTAVLDLAVEAAGAYRDAQLLIDLFGPDGDLVAVEIGTDLAAGRHVDRLHLANPRLWWPRGHGEQALYTLRAQLCVGGRLIHERTLRVGVRRVMLDQAPVVGEDGTSFGFVVNGRRIYCAGANWVPADSLLSRIDPGRYDELTGLAAAANMTMLRVWGGGLYEDDRFYDRCDELGLLVWQDFMFACAIYPAHEEFLASVRAEARAVVSRLRHHACIAVWCGNNEDYMKAEEIGAYRAADPITDKFPARVIYERLLPEVCAELDPGTPYWPGSPHGGETTGDPRAGNRHAWDLDPTPVYDSYRAAGGRFVTEFGIQAYPDTATLRAWAAGDRNKSPQGEAVMRAYTKHNIADTGAYGTQLNQAEALTAAITAWRRGYRGPGRDANTGVLIWQLGDCWPVVSWSLVDYDLRPKPAYYAVARAFAPVTVTLAPADGRVDVWGVNTSPADVDAQVRLTLWSLAGDRLATQTRRVQLPANQATEVGWSLPAPASDLVRAAVLSLAGEAVARATAWPQPYRALQLAAPTITVTRPAPDTVTLRTDAPVKGLLVDLPGVNDNLIDLMPDDPQTLRAPGVDARPILARWLGSAGTVPLKES